MTGVIDKKGGGGTIGFASAVSFLKLIEGFLIFMDMNNGVLLTASGLEGLKTELDELKNVKMPKVISRVSKAREDGDLSENGAYIFGKQEQEFLEGRIAELENILQNATLVQATVQNGKVKVVNIGCKVRVSAGKSETVFDIVGDWEAKPAERKISGSSPLGKALLGKREGDKIEVEAPAGRIEYTVLEIS